MTSVHDRLLHLGNVVVDLVLTVPRLPDRGGDVLATSARTAPGGGLNVMVAAANQGLQVAYGGAHGTGPHGDLSRAAMRAAGISVLLPPKPDLDTGLVVTMVDAEGERTFVTSPGAEATLGPVDLALVRPTAGDMVYLSGYSMLHSANRAALTAWLRALPEAIAVAFDPGPLVRDIPAHSVRRLLARADWLSCNAQEAEHLTGHRAPAQAATALTRSMARGRAVVRNGPDGCHVTPHRTADSVHVDGFRVRAVDLNGAGDAHTGTFLAALATGADPLRAARTANAAAALAVTAHGSATAPRADRLDAFLRQHPAATGR
ncbi:PfkB family carbohydrate kinase [Kitasatospora sp. NPDC058965]|uniref:PfkB family carbohydrate kinase n=1 Tax=Kitasatospora sp. NPDC058965 TaxID=3346682 RepID=UPI0036B30BF9